MDLMDDLDMPARRAPSRDTQVGDPAGRPPPDGPPAPTYRVPRSHGLDPTTKRLALVAAGLGGALILVVGIASLGGHRGGGAVPVIAADTTPIKVRPDNPGGMTVGGQDDEIMANGTTDANGRLAPPPESPAPQALRAPPAAAPAPAAPPSMAQTASVPATPPATVPPAGPVSGLPDHRTPAQRAAQAPASGANVAPPAAGGHGTLVQLGALESEQAAHTEWERLQHRLPDLLGNRQPTISRLERDGKTFWRLRTGGFADIADATQFCGKVRAKGGACSIAAF
jgi:hypothetical protein